MHKEQGGQASSLSTKERANIPACQQNKQQKTTKNPNPLTPKDLPTTNNVNNVNKR
jgi:hypothetical protein